MLILSVRELHAQQQALSLNNSLSIFQKSFFFHILHCDFFGVKTTFFIDKTCTLVAFLPWQQPAGHAYVIQKLSACNQCVTGILGLRIILFEFKCFSPPFIEVNFYHRTGTTAVNLSCKIRCRQKLIQQSFLDCSTVRQIASWPLPSRVSQLPVP